MAKKTKADPTGQRTNRQRTARRMANRLDSARRQVKKLFQAIPKTRRRKVEIQNQQQTVFDYSLSPEELEALQAEVRRLIDESLETEGESVPPVWWFASEVELPFRQGTLEELVQFNQMVAAAIAAGVVVQGLPPRPVDADQVLVSPNYRNALNDAVVTNYNNIKSLSSQVSSQVIRQISIGMRAGKKPSEIASEIDERFQVGASSAKRIADTEINAAYNNARMNAVKIAASQSGLRAGVIHISALTPTTRESHAARHGNAYTVEQQLAWWDEGANRINCKCSTRSVLIDTSGRVVQREQQQEIKREGREFFDDQNG